MIEENTYRQKVMLFEKLRDKGIFWSYTKDISFEMVGERLFLEYLLKYGDFDDLSFAFNLFERCDKKSLGRKSKT